jgi:hypothetical protein
MFDSFALPVTYDYLPWVIKDRLNREGWDLVEIKRSGWGTPDGECDTDIWNLTMVSREGGVVEFMEFVYTGHDCLALPAIEQTIVMAEWLDSGMKFTVKHKDDGYVSTKEDVPIDYGLVRKTLNKETLEVA